MEYKIKTCTRCGRKLKTEKSIELGFGPVCYRKHNAEIAEKEFRRNQMTMDEVENYRLYEEVMQHEQGY